jgi:hypothetical protein
MDHGEITAGSEEGSKEAEEQKEVGFYETFRSCRSERRIKIPLSPPFFQKGDFPSLQKTMSKVMRHHHL